MYVIKTKKMLTRHPTYCDVRTLHAAAAGFEETSELRMPHVYIIDVRYDVAAQHSATYVASAIIILLLNFRNRSLSPLCWRTLNFREFISPLFPSPFYVYIIHKYILRIRTPNVMIDDNIIISIFSFVWEIGNIIL